MADRNLQELLGTVAEPRRAPAQRAGRAERLSGRAGGVHELARRAAGMAADVRAVQPDLPHGRADGGRPGCAGAAHEPRRQQLRDLRAGQGQAVRPGTPDGYVIGDVILFGLAADRYNLVGRAPVPNWLTYHAETGGHDVEVQFDQRTALRSDLRRRYYRFQVQGPNAMAVLEKALGHAPRTSSSSTCAPSRSPARGHARCATAWPASRAGSSSDRSRTARPSMRRSCERGPGSRAHARRRAAYGSNAIESGWIPSPLPAVYTGDGLTAYREWLPAAGYEGSASLGGSFVSSKTLRTTI